VIARVNGIQLSYDQVGTDVPIVFLHAFPLDRSMWAPQVGEFTGSGWRVITPCASTG
jgi:3-oxoadipate enol-lactonase